MNHVCGEFLSQGTRFLVLLIALPIAGKINFVGRDMKEAHSWNYHLFRWKDCFLGYFHVNTIC